MRDIKIDINKDARLALEKALAETAPDKNPSAVIIHIDREGKHVTTTAYNVSPLELMKIYSHLLEELHSQFEATPHGNA